MGRVPGRPVHGIVALLDGAVVPFSLFDVAAGDTTVGHATLSPEPFRVGGWESYRRELAARGVVVEVAERRERLLAGMRERAAAAGGELVTDEPLLDKLAAICEIPGVLEGAFDPRFLALPREVLTASLRDHQSALTVEREGALLPLFLTVMDRPEIRGAVRAGQRVGVAARLADASFARKMPRPRSPGDGAPGASPSRAARQYARRASASSASRPPRELLGWEGTAGALAAARCSRPPPTEM